MPNVWICGQLPPQDDNDEDLQIKSPCPSNWSNDLLIVDNNKDEKMEQTEQPTENTTTQGILTNTSTTLRLPQTMPQVLRIQKQTGKTKQKTRLSYTTWILKKSQKQDSPEQK